MRWCLSRLEIEPVVGLWDWIDGEYLEWGQGEGQGGTTKVTKGTKRGGERGSRFFYDVQNWSCGWGTAIGTRSGRRKRKGVRYCPPGGPNEEITWVCCTSNSKRK